MTLILASQSASRRAMLDAAGVAYAAEPARVDEDGVKSAMAGRPPRDVADALAELKAVKVSQAHPGALVLGSDSVTTLVHHSSEIVPSGSGLDGGIAADAPTIVVVNAQRRSPGTHCEAFAVVVHLVVMARPGGTARLIAEASEMPDAVHAE